MADDETKSGPRFLVYFGPVLDGLRDLGGEATPEKVCQWIRERLDIPEEELATTKGGRQTKFENKVGWARFYLVKAGLIDGSKHGLWKLTPEGERTELDAESALPIFKTVQEKFRAAEDEDQPAPNQVSGNELFADPGRRFWFVGASWSEGDQTERFVKEGVWQNDYKDKFLDHVKAMKPGDKIAIKATFTQKYDLPFDNKGKTVSVMRLKAIGTITGNHGDGRTVEVEWERLDPPRDWYFYTYRVTVVEADASDDLARRLLLFAFGDAKQDYGFWTSKVPYFAKRFAEDEHADEILASEEGEEEEGQNSDPTYTLDNILDEGCFVSREELERCLSRLRAKQNLILQGPPGTGKTWLAKRLGYVLLGSRDRRSTKHRMRVVQFHPSLSYEDFVRGWRPSSGGQLRLVDGVFLETVQAAIAEPDRPFVLIIEEINRGNPAQIFGEMLTLLENTKRRPEEAMELAYRREQGEQVFVPKNLYVIGTMNLADRSLAIVDMALRRRFSFVTLNPQFNEPWSTWCQKVGGLSSEFVTDIAARLAALNRQISEDRTLGEQYCIGHSYFTPGEATAPLDGRRWFAEIVDAEIIPLLEEYWFDDAAKVETARAALLDGLV